MQSLVAVLLLVTFASTAAGYYSVEGNYQPNPSLPWTPVTNNDNNKILPGPAGINGQPPTAYPYGSYPYGRQFPWPYGPTNPYYGPDNSGGGSYGGYSNNWPYQSQNWLPWRPLVPQPKPLEQKVNSTGTVVEVPIEQAVAGLPGEKPFPTNNERK